MPQARSAKPETLDHFARGRAGELLDRLALQVDNVCRKSDPDSIHDLRVSIRRLTQALRALRGLFPKRAIKPLRRNLRGMMDIAAEIRNRDIALELLQAAGVPSDAPLCAALAAQRDTSRAAIVAMARQWRRRKLPAAWKVILERAS